MIKKVLIICILFFITSCEIQYDAETKIVVTGKIVDENDNPLSNQDIYVTIVGEGFLQPNSDIISYGKSDQNGNYTLIFPAPKGDYPISISINEYYQNNSVYEDKTILATIENFKNYKLNLNKIKLYKKESITTLQLFLNTTSTNRQVTDIKIEGKQTNNFIDLNSAQNNSNNFENFFYITKNQTVNLKYTTADFSSGVAILTNHSVLIPILSDAVTYTITY